MFSVSHVSFQEYSTRFWLECLLVWSNVYSVYFLVTQDTTIFRSVTACYALNIKDSEVNVVKSKALLSSSISSFLPPKLPINWFPWHKWSSHLQTGRRKYFCYCVIIPDWESNVVSPSCLCSMTKTDGIKSVSDLILWFTLTSCNLLFLLLIRWF